MTDSDLTVSLALKRLPATRIARKRWHTRKRQQTVLVWKHHDFDELLLLGATNRERTERARREKEKRSEQID